MDAGDIYKASSSLRTSTRGSASLRVNSSNLWRNTGLEIFSRSAREEDDEEALKWAALEKLPTYDRLRKGLLHGSKGANQIDIGSLGYDDKRDLVDRLVTNVDDDNEKFLLKHRKRIDRYIYYFQLINSYIAVINCDQSAELELIYQQLK